MESTQLEVEVHSGDIILFSRPCSKMDVASSLICYSAKFLGWTDWDHLGLVVQNPENQEFYLLEANINGITCHLLRERFQRSKSQKFAIRKLVIQSNGVVSNKTNTAVYDEFRTELWRLSQLYLDKRYNTSFLHMIDAMISSYSHSFSPTSKVLNMKHQLLLLRENEFLLKNELDNKNRKSDAFLNQIIIKSLHHLRQKIAKLVEDIDMADRTSSATFRTPNSSTSTQSEAYYCSQLVAEIFMEMNVLSSHRYSHQYIPADFSSSTLIKGFVTHSYDSLVVNDFSSLSTEKTHKYLYSPDVVIPNKQNLQILDEDVFSLQFEIFPRDVHKGSSKEPKLEPKYTYRIPFHTCDLLPLTVLKGLLESPEALAIKVHGDIRVYRKIPVIETNNSSQENYETVIVLNDKTSADLDIYRFLKLLSQQKSEFYLSAVHSSSLDISTCETRLNSVADSKVAEKSRVLLLQSQIARQAEVVAHLFCNSSFNLPSEASQDLSPPIFQNLRNILQEQLQTTLEEELDLEKKLERFQICCGDEIARQILNDSKKNFKDIQSTSLALLSLFFLFQDAITLNNFELFFVAIDFYLGSTSQEVKRELMENVEAVAKAKMREKGLWETNQNIFFPISTFSFLPWVQTAVKKNERYRSFLRLLKTSWKKETKFTGRFCSVVGSFKKKNLVFGSIAVVSYFILNRERGDAL